MNKMLQAFLSLSLFLFLASSVQGLRAGICQKVERYSAISDRLMAKLESPIKRFLKDNELLLSSPDVFEGTMGVWDRRFQWTQHSLQTLAEICKRLSDEPGPQFVVVLYQRSTIVFRSGQQPGHAMLEVSEVMRMYPQREIAQSVSGDQCGAWCVSQSGQLSPQCEGLVGKAEAVYFNKTIGTPDFAADSPYQAQKAGKALYFHLSLIYVQGDLPKDALEFWTQPQAFEIMDFDITKGQRFGTGKYMPDDRFIRLREEDFDKLKEGVKTEDFLLRPLVMVPH